jgi:hypothetical protein
MNSKQRLEIEELIRSVVREELTAGLDDDIKRLRALGKPKLSCDERLQQWAKRVNTLIAKHKAPDVPYSPGFREETRDALRLEMAIDQLERTPGVGRAELLGSIECFFAHCWVFDGSDPETSRWRFELLERLSTLLGKKRINL